MSQEIIEHLQTGPLQMPHDAAQSVARAVAATGVAHGVFWQILGKYGRVVIQVVLMKAAGKTNAEIIAAFPGNPFIVQIVEALWGAVVKPA